MYKTLRRLIRKRYLCFFLLAAAVFTALGGVYHELVLVQTRTLAITLNYPGAELGLNPDGTRFSISELTSDSILDAAKAGLVMEGQSNRSIRDSMSITTQLGGASYVPTTFFLTYSQRDKLEETESGTFLQALAGHYTRDFSEQHGVNRSIPAFDPEQWDLSGFDYTEICDLLSDKAEQILDSLQQRSGDLEPLRDQLTSFCAVELETFRAYIVQNNISKDRSAAVSKLRCLIGRERLLYQKSAQAASIAQEALAQYGASPYVSRTQAEMDELVQSSYASGTEAARIARQIDSDSRNYQRLSEAAEATPELLRDADAYLQDIILSFAQLSQQIAALDSEYLANQAEEYLTCQLVEQRPIVDTAVRFGVCGAAFALLAVCYAEFLCGPAKNRERQTDAAHHN